MPPAAPSLPRASFCSPRNPTTPPAPAPRSLPPGKMADPQPIFGSPSRAVFWKYVSTALVITKTSAQTFAPGALTYKLAISVQWVSKNPVAYNKPEPGHPCPGRRNAAKASEQSLHKLVSVGCACETCTWGESQRQRVFEQLARRPCVLRIFKRAKPMRGKPQ